MGNIRTIGQVTAYKSITRYGMEELAVRQMSIQPSGGILFARNPDRVQKDIARQRALDLFIPEKGPGLAERRSEQCSLRILCMPGLHWRFERKLLGKREGNWEGKLIVPKFTKITAVENDRAIYYAAISKMPGLHAVKSKTSILTPPPFAEQAVKTRYVDFLFCDVDDLMKETQETWDAAWIDYTGPMSIDRMKIIKTFYQRSVRGILIITALKARWNKDTSAAIERFGTHSEWLRHHLDGELLHDIEYMDTSPMAQFAVRKRATTQREENA